MKTYFQLAFIISVFGWAVLTELRLHLMQKQIGRNSIKFLNTVDASGNFVRVPVIANQFPNGVEIELGLRGSDQTVIWSVKP